MKKRTSFWITYFALTGLSIGMSGMSASAQDINFTSEYNKITWPQSLGVGGGIIGDDGNFKRVAIYHGHSISLQTGSNTPSNSHARLYIDASGKIGLGTTTPVANARLDIQGGSINIGGPGAADAVIHVKTGSFSPWDRMTQMSPSVANKPALNLMASKSAAGTDQWWVWGVSIDNKWRIHTGTNFNPNGGLAIDGSNNISLEGKITSGIEFPSSWSGPDGNFVGTAGNYLGFGHAGVSEDFIGYKNNTFFFKDTPAGGEAIDPNVVVGGSLGIGNAQPKAKLQVDGASGVQSRVRVNAPFVGAEARYDMAIGTADDDCAAGMRGYVPVGQPGFDRVFLGLYTTTFEGGLQSRIERLTVTDRGNVGIGTTNPQQKLHVKGTVYSTEVKVDVAAGTGPDYVFADNYQLPTLTEVKSYIDQHKHLPEVPSAKEMEANGVNLGAMNLLLLKKIEEMTLYQIQLLDEIQRIKLKISGLEKAHPNTKK